MVLESFARASGVHPFLRDAAVVRQGLKVP